MKICEFNVENLFIHLDFYKGESLSNCSEDLWQSFTSSNRPNKKLSKIWGVVESMELADADIFGLVELGGIESAQNFNKLFLNDKYILAMEEGNSERGIDVCYFVHPRVLETHILSFKTNKDFKFAHGETESSFSRDALELQLTAKVATSKSYTFFLVHLKSKISTFSDFQGKRIRGREVGGLMELVKMRKESNPQSHVVLLGDFNGVIHEEEEFTPLLKNEYIIDPLHSLEDKKRVSHFHFDFHTKLMHEKPFDYILVDKKLMEFVDLSQSGSQPFTVFGFEDPFPTDFLSKKSKPSDHLPVVLVIN